MTVIGKTDRSNASATGNAFLDITQAAGQQTEAEKALILAELNDTTRETIDAYKAAIAKLLPLLNEIKSSPSDSYNITIPETKYLNQHADPAYHNRPAYAQTQTVNKPVYLDDLLLKQFLELIDGGAFNEYATITENPNYKAFSVAKTNLQAALTKLLGKDSAGGEAQKATNKAVAEVISLINSEPLK